MQPRDTKYVHRTLSYPVIGSKPTHSFSSFTSALNQLFFLGMGKPVWHKN